MSRFPNVKPAFIYALAAIMGDVTGSGWLCPSEVVKQQLQAGIYPSMSEAIKGIWKKSGMAGFYQGYTGGLARYVLCVTYGTSWNSALVFVLAHIISCTLSIRCSATCHSVWLN